MFSLFVTQMKKESIIPGISIAAIFVLVYSLSLLSVKPFEVANVKAFENPEDPSNLIYFLVILLALTLFVLIVSRFWKKEIVYVFIILAVTTTTIYALYPPLAYLTNDLAAFTIAIISALLVVFLLIKHPEWYVIDACCVLISVGAITIFGISLSISLVVFLLIALAIYDAIAVYKTKHMIELADTVVGLKLPVLFIVPKKLSYSFIKEKGIKERKERDAFFIGVGDVVMPGILVVSAYHFTRNTLVSLSIILGILFSLFVLMNFVSRGKAQPGLPFLNSGAIAGYLLSSLLLYGDLTGFTLGLIHIPCI